MITIGQGIIIGAGITMLPKSLPPIAFDPLYLGPGVALANLNTSMFDNYPGIYAGLTNYQLGTGDHVMVSYVLDYYTDPASSIGIGTPDMNFSDYLGADAFSIGFNSAGEYWFNGTQYGSGYPQFINNGDVIDLAINVTDQLMWIRVNGGVWNVTGGDPATNTNGVAIGGLTAGFPAVAIGGFSGPSQFTLQTEAQYSVPAGYEFLAPNTGLVAEYDTINYVSGPTWTDTSGNGNDLVLVNSSDIIFNSGGIFAPANYFSTGATGYFASPGSSVVPQGSDAYTMMVWVKFPILPTGDSGLISIGGYGTASQSNAFRTGGGAFLINYWWGNDLSVSDPNITTDTWFLATVTCNGTVRKIYHNDSLLGTDSQSGHNVISTTIQVAKTYSTEYLQGDIAMARIYNRELTAEEVASVVTEFGYRYGI